MHSLIVFLFWRRCEKRKCSWRWCSLMRDIQLRTTEIFVYEWETTNISWWLNARESRVGAKKSALNHFSHDVAKFFVFSGENVNWKFPLTKIFVLLIGKTQSNIDLFVIKIPWEMENPIFFFCRLSSAQKKKQQSSAFLSALSRCSFIWEES